VLCLYPVVAARFVLVDDHEIMSYAPRTRPGPGDTAITQLGSVLEHEARALGRFRPVYWAVRLAEVDVLGQNPATWHTLALMLGLASAGLLFSTARLVGVCCVPAFLLAASLLVAPGVSSVWVRLGPPETIGTFFFLLSAFSAAMSARGRGTIWDVAFVVSAILATLSKEPFALSAPALAGLRVVLEQRPARWRAVVAAAVVIAGGTAVGAIAYKVAASAGISTYGGRYLSGVDLPQFAVTVLHNAAILVVASTAWLAPLIALPGATVRRYRLSRRAGLAVILVVVLVIPQLALYSLQGVMEGRYELPSTIGLAAVPALALSWLASLGARRAYLLGVAAWSSVLLLFGFSTWTYATAFTADSVQLDRMLATVAESAPPNALVALVADPGRQFEPALSIVDQLVSRGRADLRMRLVPLRRDGQYTPNEAALARNLPDSIPLLEAVSAGSPCANLGAAIVLANIPPDEVLPCAAAELRPVRFTTTALVWGSETVSLRPRLPGVVSVGYLALVP
jgi:hypothetical protein